MKPREVAPRGLLADEVGQRKYRLAQIQPSDDLSPFVEQYWIVAWDLRGEPPFRQDTLPYPSVHLVFEPEGARLYGVVTRTFSRLLAGSGRAVGVKFRPGGFRSFLGRPVREITDRVVSAAGVFGPDVEHARAALTAVEGDVAAAALAERFVRRHLPAGAHDAGVALTAQVVERILADHTMRRVEDVAHAFSLSVRSLQRLFGEYVGVSPKWVIKRSRLHEALAQLEAGVPPDWARLARELGYFDQAHFIHDFKALIGRTPAEYAHARSA